MLFYMTLGVLIVITFVLLSHVKRTYDRGQTLSRFASLGFWVIDALLFVLILVSSLFKEYAIFVIPLSETGVLVGGCILIGIGSALMLTGMMEFRSIKMISGHDMSRLVKTGIYRCSRNPQYIGWFLILFGLSLAGRSSLALLLASVGALLFHLFTVRMEEPYLERLFGDGYVSYRETTPRYIGISRQMNNDKTDSVMARSE